MPPKHMALLVPGADFSGSPHPKFVRTVQGFPSLNLKRLYLFNDGTVGQPLSTFADSGPDAVPGVIYLNRTPPTRETYGINVTDADGLVIDTGLTQPKAYTWILAMKRGTPPATGFPYVIGTTGFGIPATKTASHTNPSTVVVNMSIDNNNWGVFRNGTLFSGTNRMAISAIFGRPTHAMVLSFKFNAGNGQLSFRTASGGSIGGTYEGLIDEYGTGTVSVRALFGMIPNGLNRPANAEIYGAALYNTFLGTEAEDMAIARMVTHVESKGVDVFGA